MSAPSEVRVQFSSSSKWVSPPLPSPGESAWAKTPLTPSNGAKSPWSGFERRRVKLTLGQTFSQRHLRHCITSSLEHDHNVSGAANDLLEIQRNDVTIEFQSLGYGGIHIMFTQVWCVVSYSKAIWEWKWFTLYCALCLDELLAETCCSLFWHVDLV